MSKITLKDLKIPNTCGECNCIGYYETGAYARNSHCCCELMWLLKKEDYKVDKNSLDRDCPLKIINENFKEAI